MNFEKENFLRTRFIRYLQQLDPGETSVSGKISVQQMIEHYNEDVVKLANGKTRIPEILTAPAQLPAMLEFLLGDQPFKKNLENPLPGKDPSVLQFNTVQAAIGALHEELIFFFEVFEKDHTLTTRNPFYGDLNFEQNVQLLYKYALHQLREFGVEPLNG